jgi:hypothetical protein
VTKCVIELAALLNAQTVTRKPRLSLVSLFWVKRTLPYTIPVSSVAVLLPYQFIDA